MTETTPQTRYTMAAEDQERLDVALARLSDSALAERVAVLAATLKRAEAESARRGE